MRPLLRTGRCVLLLSLLLLLVSSCAVGRIYTHVTEPLDTNYDRTPVGDLDHRSDVKKYSYRYFDVGWDSNAIGDIMRRHDFEEAYYADLETMTFLSFFSTYTVHVYGR